ncbi:predicted protein [Nematostella vectensis]|uniref:Dymeclin n=1 Tax=Nematostella vectensis TaxID=45351 RepID=A7RPK6_NEMVE|nr:predicted protein [Nematostella vectensis]|eukprot:XP_001638589.1 predicted protein [Nematostella vectensis]
MGARPSSISDLQHNAVLKKLTGELSVGDDEEFWDELLSFSFRVPYNSADARLLEEATEPICQHLAQNNLTSKNFIFLVRVLLSRISELKNSDKAEDSDFLVQLYNALLLKRSFCKYFVEMLPYCGITEDAICGLFDILISIPVNNQTYALHVETMNCVLVLLAVQMFDPNASSNSIFYHTIMRGKCAKMSGNIVHSLLQNFIQQMPTPAEIFIISAGFWWLFGSQSTEEESDPLLANQSLLLLLVLVNHCTQSKKKMNPYRLALFSFADRQAKASGGKSPDEKRRADPPFCINLGLLYTTICKGLIKDQTTLLLYLILHRNPNVSSFILSRTDIDTLVIPILKLLYNAEEQNAHHIYMSLIILLILSQDENFNKSVHELVISNIPWYTERVITNITLGGLLVLVVLRTIQYNMTKMRDKYLHTNCLATLANMSSQFHALHPYVTQRIVSLYALLSKKHAKVTEHIKQLETTPLVTENGGPDHAAGSHDADSEHYMADLAILEEVLRMVLEIINSCVTNTLHHNPNLVYTLLHRRELFAQFRTHPTFQDIIQNIDTVLAFFSARLEQHPDQTLSVGVVLDVIKQGTLQWPKDRLKKFPELKFKYVEEEQPEEFFIPYVWFRVQVINPLLEQRSYHALPARFLT